VALLRARYLLAASIVASSCASAEPASISGFSPGTGPAGVTVTVRGAGLQDTQDATIGGTTAPLVSVSASRVVLRVPDGAVTGLVALTSPSGTVTSRLRFIVAASGTLAVTPPPPPVVATATGYSFVTVTVAQGTFGVHVIKEPLADVTVKTVTANVEDCRRDCPAKTLADFVTEHGAYAAMNGTYLCPPDYADCTTKVNSFEYAVYNTGLRKWINLPSLLTQNGLVTFTGKTPTFYRRSAVYARQRLSLAPITAGLTMYPLLLEAGDVVNSDAEQSPAQKQRSMKGAIGSDGTFLFLCLIANVTVAESADVLQALGVRDALNLDGGGTSAMWFGGAYRVGPGRLLPNAIVLTRP
jgi:hypothetical protein